MRKGLARQNGFKEHSKTDVSGTSYISHVQRTTARFFVCNLCVAPTFSFGWNKEVFDLICYVAISPVCFAVGISPACSEVLI